MNDIPDCSDPEWVVSILKEMEGYVHDLTLEDDDAEQAQLCDNLFDCINKLQEYYGEY